MSILFLSQRHFTLVNFFVVLGNVRFNTKPVLNPFSPPSLPPTKLLPPHPPLLTFFAFHFRPNITNNHRQKYLHLYPLTLHVFVELHPSPTSSQLDSDFIPDINFHFYIYHIFHVYFTKKPKDLNPSCKIYKIFFSRKEC